MQIHKEQHLALFIIGLANLVDGIGLVLSLGRVTIGAVDYLLFKSDWFQRVMTHLVLLFIQSSSQLFQQ